MGTIYRARTQEKSRSLARWRTRDDIVGGQWTFLRFAGLIVMALEPAQALRRSGQARVPVLPRCRASRKTIRDAKGAKARALRKQEKSAAPEGRATAAGTAEWTALPCKRGRRELRWAAERFFDECDDRVDEWRFPFEGSV